MLSTSRQRGFTVIELMVGIVVLGLLLALGGPSFSQWLHNVRLRNMSESVLNGIQLARAEAVRRNAQVRFQLVDNLTDSCALTTAGPNWVISMDSAAGACASTNMADDAAPAAPRMIQSRAASDGSSSVVVAADQSSVVFNGLGRPTATLTVNITNPAGGACAAGGGPMRCLRIAVTAGGQVRMCDPRSSFDGTSEGC